MSDNPIKHVSVKRPGTGDPISTLGLEPGTRVSDCLTSLGCTSGYHLVDPHNPDKVFRPTDDLYASVEDGQVLAVMAAVDAGARASTEDDLADFLQPAIKFKRAARRAHDKACAMSVYETAMQHSCTDWLTATSDVITYVDEFTAAMPDLLKAIQAKQSPAGTVAEVST